MNMKTMFFLISLVGSLYGLRGNATPADGTVFGATKILDNGLATDRFNLVLIAEGYRKSELPSFAADAAQFAEFFLKTPPYDTNSGAFNIWRIDVISKDSGADDPGACGGSREKPDTFFDASFCGDGRIRRLLRVDNRTVFNVLNAEIPEWDQALVIVNSTIFGGRGGTPAVTSLAGSWETIAIHELGHSVFCLADEYEYWRGCGSGEMDRTNHPPCEPVQPNVTTETNRALVKWKDLILPKTEVPTTVNPDCTTCDSRSNPFPRQTVVGLYEGAHYYHCDAFRPVFSCMMRDFGPFCPVCTKRILDVLEPYQPRHDLFFPIADATIKRNSPRKNFGGAGKVETDNRPLEQFLMKFSVSGIGTAKVSSAKLRLYCSNGSDKGGDFHRSNNNWSENTVTWNNAPPADPKVIASLNRVVQDTWVEVDVTSLIKRDGVYSFRAISTSANGADFVSREKAELGLAPRLLIEIENTLTFTPKEDTSIKIDFPKKNFGTLSKLETDRLPKENFLMKFSVSGIRRRQVQSAKLRLFCINGSNRGGEIHLTDNDWSETRVTWNNAPPADTKVFASLGRVAPFTWVEVDLTSLITEDGVYSLRMRSTSKDGADYRSKERAGLEPKLIVTVK